MILTDFLASNSYIITNKLLIRNCRNRCYNYIRRVTFRIQLLGKTGQLTNEECFFSTRKNIEHNTGLSEHKQRIAIKKLLEMKLISTKRMGVPCKTYYKINENAILKLYEDTKTIFKKDITNQVLKNSENKNSKNLISNYGNFEELDYENLNINNNNKNNKNNNKEYMQNTLYKNNQFNNSMNTKRNYKSNYEQRVYPERFFDQFYANFK